MIKNYNALSASLGQFNAEKDKLAANIVNEKMMKEMGKAEKKATKESKENKTQDELLPGMEEDIKKGLA